MLTVQSDDLKQPWNLPTRRLNTITRSILLLLISIGMRIREYQAYVAEQAARRQAYMESMEKARVEVITEGKDNGEPFNEDEKSLLLEQLTKLHNPIINFLMTLP